MDFLEKDFLEKSPQKCAFKRQIKDSVNFHLNTLLFN